MNSNLRKIFFFRIILIILSVVLCVMAIRLTFTPIYRTDTFDSLIPAESAPVYAGDSVYFTFKPCYGYIEAVELAINFDTEDKRARDTSVDIYIEDTLNAKNLSEQELLLYAIPSETFFPLYVGKYIPFHSDASVMVRLTNATASKDTSIPFTLLTDNEGNYFYRVTYIAGYETYRTLASLFVIILFAVILFIKADAIISYMRPKMPRKNV